ncbi:hypothetical protein K435DRAFT_733201, partial [Dendrothele bispora CBS 962.96]
MPLFSKHSVDPQRPDGYWIETFPYTLDDKAVPHLIGYGLGTSNSTSKIQLYLNPSNPRSPALPVSDVGWQRQEIAELRFPVACSYADIAVSNPGFNDVILSDEYGPSMDDICPNGGRISWFKNTGTMDSNHWDRRYIGKSPGMHRLKVGHFTTIEKIQIIAVPIVIASSDLESPVPVIIYTSPDNPESYPVNDDTKGWKVDRPFSKEFRLVHEIYIYHPSSDVGANLDKILLAGREGINLIWYCPSRGQWQKQNIGQGLPKDPGGKNPYWGSGSVAVAKVRDDRAGYIACAEAFHGNHVSVYIKGSTAPADQLEDIKWTRYELENLGPLNSKYTGSIHQVVCADIDGDGVEEILVAMMGADPPTSEKTGVWCYKPVDLARGVFSRTKLSDDSAGRIGVGDFTGRGLIDFATISYSVPDYFESPNPAVNMYESNFKITAQKLNDEVLFMIPNPPALMSNAIDEAEFLDVSSRRLALVVAGPNGNYLVKRGSGVKVIFGQLSWQDNEDKTQTRTQATSPFRVVSNIINADSVQAGPAGAAFVILRESTTSGRPPYPDMNQLEANNIFPERFPEEVKNMRFDWVKVENRPWANGRFKDLEFYNLVGFQVRIGDDSLTNICHIQMWTAGVGVSAGFHNHTDAIFCEIHSCIVNGTGNGGMSWATVDDNKFNPADPDKSQYDSLVVPDMHEHGPLWRVREDGLPKLRNNGTVDYPWHAWLAGDVGGGQRQSFDVWLAFEFPSLIAKSLRADMLFPSPGIYTLLCKANATQGAASVQDSNSTDGTAIIGVEPNKEKADQQWKIAIIAGTNAVTALNVGSGSFASSSWPPVSDQQLVGSRSLAVLGVTSNWVL